MRKEKKPKIVATLKYGRFLSGWLLGLFVFILCLSVTTILFVVIYFSLSRCGIIPIDEDEITFLYSIILMILGLAYSLWFFIKRAKTKKKINLWLQDAIPLKAHSKSIAKRDSRITLPQFAIEIDFVYDDRLIIQRSGNPEKKNYPKNGLDTIFGYYINREINILYSPNYNEVMILKD